MTRSASFRASQAFNRASWVQSTVPTGSSFINRSEIIDTEALPPHPSHATVRDWMPVAEALRLADLWTVGDLDNSGQWRAAIKVLADEVRAALAQRQQVPAVPQAAEPQQDSLACYHRALVFMVGQLDDAATILENAGKPFAAQAARSAITQAWHYASGRQT